MYCTPKPRADTGLDDFGADDYRERLDVYLAALQEIDGMHRSGVVNFHAQLLQWLKNRLLLTDLLDAPSRDPRHRAAAARRHRGPAAHRHHPSAQPAGRGADVPHDAVLGEQRAVPAARRGGGRAGPRAGRGWMSRFRS